MELCQPDSLVSILGLPDALDSFTLQERSKALADNPMIVRQKYSERHPKSPAKV